MEPDALQIDDDREWIQWCIEDEEYLDREYQWWRDNELLVAASLGENNELQNAQRERRQHGQHVCTVPD